MKNEDRLRKIKKDIRDNKAKLEALKPTYFKYMELMYKVRQLESDLENYKLTGLSVYL